MIFTVHPRPHGESLLRTRHGAGPLILEALGLSDPAGQEEPDVFYGRVLLALALAPTSPAKPGRVVREKYRAIRVEGALEEGYVQLVLEGLLSLADEAVRTTSFVRWAA